MRHLIQYLLLCCLPLCLSAAEPFKENARVAFVGDSITHGGSYHTFIQTFYATRFPQRNVICYNVGISGDNARGGFQRASKEGDGIWESDVRMYAPTAATIMLGMNDVGGWQFTSSETREALDASNQQQLVWYKSNYKQLLNNLEAIGLSEITLIKPSPYDQTMVNEQASENLFKFGQGKNDVILAASQVAIEVEAQARGYPIVDFNTPLLTINAHQQATDPSFSIVGLDRVHPGLQGHMVMAYTFLKAQGLAGPVAEVSIDAASNEVLSANNCSIKKLQSTTDAVQFDYIAQSLPFPTGPYKAVSDYIPFDTEFNQERLTVQHLQAGSYTLNIDTTFCGTFTAAELAKGINLAHIKQAPQVVQCEAVFAQCQARAKLAGQIRSIVWSVGYLSKIKGHDAQDYESNIAMIARIDEGFEPEGVWGTPSAYVKSQLHIYRDHAPSYFKKVDELKAMSAPLYAAAQPKAHRIHLSPIK